MLTEVIEELCVCTYVDSRSLTMTVEIGKIKWSRHVAIYNIN